MGTKNVKWQVPVRERLLEGKPDWVHPLTKAHCFVSNSSLCGRYTQDTDFYETDVANIDILTHPETACKSCYRKWVKRYNILRCLQGEINERNNINCNDVDCNDLYIHILCSTDI